MKFVIWAKMRGRQRFYRAFETNDSEKADRLAMNYANSGIYREVKVEAIDGHHKETMIYK